MLRDMNLMFHSLLSIIYYSTTVILPYKVKRTRKIRDRNTPYCPGLTGLQQGAGCKRSNLWLNWRTKI